MRFKIIDTTTGQEVSQDKIKQIAKDYNLLKMDIDEFSINESGRLLLSDDCGKSVYIDAEKYNLMPAFEGKYPDLEYFEAVFLGNVRSKYPDHFEKSVWMPTVELVDMFSQTWPDTAGGFSEPKMLAGQAFTTEITTVMRLSSKNNDFYGIFFGDKPAYIVKDANITFFKDLKEHNLKSRYESKEYY